MDTKGETKSYGIHIETLRADRLLTGSRVKNLEAKFY